MAWNSAELASSSTLAGPNSPAIARLNSLLQLALTPQSTSSARQLAATHSPTSLLSLAPLPSVFTGHDKSSAPLFEQKSSIPQHQSSSHSEHVPPPSQHVASAPDGHAGASTTSMPQLAAV
jgi:hypothetical protein